MTSRKSKQFFYGIFYLAILFFLIYGIYLIFKPAPSCFDNIQNEGETGVDCGGPCAPCTFNLAPLQEIGQVKILPLDNTSVSLLAQIQNSNSGFGAFKFDYVFNVYDNKGKEVASLGGNSYIYPGKTKYILAPNIQVPNINNLGRAELILSNPDWQPADNFQNFLVQIQNQETATTTVGVKTSGYLFNNSGFLISQADVFAIFYDISGLVVGASQTEINNLPLLRSVPFTISHPIIKNLNIQATKVFVDMPPSR
jgi:hypothetical protein